MTIYCLGFFPDTRTLFSHIYKQIKTVFDLFFSMTSKHVLEDFFKSEAYAASFKRGEMVTYPFARMLVEQSKLASESKAYPNSPPMVLDNACGTGVVSSILHQELDSNTKERWRLTCGDLSAAVLQYTQRRMEEEGWQNAETKVVDAQAPGLPSACFTHIFTAFGYMAFPQSLKSLDETLRMLKPGGTIAFSTWVEPGWVSVARKAIQSMPGDLPFPPFADISVTTSDGEWHSVSWIKSQLEQRGCDDIDVRVATANISLHSDVFVDMSMLMLPIITERFWSEEQRETNQDNVHAALEKYVEEKFGSDGDVETEWVAVLSTARKSL